MLKNTGIYREIVFAKQGPVRFISHLDLMRCFERALRRAEVPVAHSEGFNPRPKLVFSSPLSLGVTSACERLCLTLTRGLDNRDLAKQLNRQLPEGLGVREVATLYAKPKYHLLDRCHYEVTLPGEAASSETALDERLAALLAQNEVRVPRRRPKGTNVVNIRPYIRALERVGNSIRMELAMGDSGTAKPGEVLLALGLSEAGEIPPTVRVHRVALCQGDSARRP